MKLDLLLADTARVAEGKLDALGIGWALTVAGASYAVCGVVHVPWDQAAERHSLVLELIDGDGEPFSFPEHDEPAMWTFQQDVSLRETANPQVKPGTALTWPFVLNANGFPLEEDTLYVWRASIDGHHEEGWTRPFRTLPAIANPSDPETESG